mgnify:CR=1 FL=1
MTATLLEVMAETARRCAAGFDSTCTAAGTTTTLVDAVAADEGVSTTFAQGGWILRPDAPTADDQVRRISLFDPATGTFTVSRAWADAPDDAEAYYVFAILPPLALPGIPESWQRLVNRGLAATWYDAAIPVAAGDGTLNRFPLAAEDGWVPNDQQVKMVLFRTYLDNGNVRDLPLNTGGRKWRRCRCPARRTTTIDSDPPVPDGRGFVWESPAAPDRVIVRVGRPPSRDDEPDRSVPLARPGVVAPSSPPEPPPRDRPTDVAARLGP